MKQVLFPDALYQLNTGLFERGADVPSRTIRIHGHLLNVGLFADRLNELLERAMDAANGVTFQQLWRGSMAGDPSQSEADMALCCLLAFWTGGDRQRMDRLFRESGLMRGKWDEVHYADGRTYGEVTIEWALQVTSSPR